MKRVTFFKQSQFAIALLLLSSFTLFAAEISVTTANFKTTYDNASDGDVLLMASGTYTTKIDFPVGKAITLKAQPDADVIIKHEIGGNSTTNYGSLIFDGVNIKRENDYFISADLGNVNQIIFRNLTISNVNRCLIRTNTEGYEINLIEFDNCIIKDCGSNGWNLIYPKHIVKEVITKNSTLYNYTNGESFFFANATDTSNEFNFVFENNTVYKWAKNDDRALCKTEGKYNSASTYSFKNNIITVPGVAGKKPQIVQVSSGIVTGSNNLILDYGSYTGGTQTISDYSIGDFPELEGSIGFPDPDNGDFTITSLSPLATAGTDGDPLGDPRWIVEVAAPVTVTTSVYPEGAGNASPLSSIVEQGSNLQLSATRSFGYEFVGWKDADTESILSTDNPYSHTANEDKELIAVFDPIDTYVLTVNTAGSSWGEVKLNPAPTDGTYETGTEVTVTIVPNGVANFLNWDNESTNPSRTVTMSKNKSVTANFEETPFIVGWNFRVADPRQKRPADLYDNSENRGEFSAIHLNGTYANWLAKPDGSFTPSTPCAHLWTPPADFESNRRYYLAEFSTSGYKNIVINSQMAANYHHYKDQTLQVSLDGENYTEVARLAVSTSNWEDLNAALPAAYNNQSTVYVRWIGDDTSGTDGDPTAVDGTAITNVYVYADPIGTGTVENAFIPTSTVYANSNQQIVIHLTTNQSNAWIYNVSGQLIEELTIKDGSALTKSLDAGIYMIKIITGNQSKTHKLIIQ